MKLDTHMLAFARSLQVSEGLFTAVRRAGDAGDEEEAAPVPVVEKSVRGQISNYVRNASEFNIDNANLQRIDSAAMPPGYDRLRIAFTMVILPNSRRPVATDDHLVARGYEELTERYRERNGYRFLAARYVWNIANARWIWRNRFLAEGGAEVAVAFEGRKLRFDPFRLGLDAYPGLGALRDAAVDGGEFVDHLVERVATALGDPEGRLTMACAFEARVPALSEVFPSQEIPSEAVKNERPGRILSSVEVEFARRPVRQASLHSQKIGAAIRTIDEWHGSEELPGLAVSINPYAGVTERKLALRGVTGPNFYRLIKQADELRKLASGSSTAFEDNDTVAGDLHFVVANLIRGGVYGLKAEA